MNIGIINLNGGEFTPHIDCRSDLEKYPSGCRHCENFIPKIYGDVERRPGTIFVAMTIDTEEIMPSIISHENLESCYENIVVTTDGNVYIPVFHCYENEIVCNENKVVVLTESFAFSDMVVCYENKVVFNENEIVTYS